MSVAIHWNLSRCTTSDVEDLVSVIEPFIYLREVNTTINEFLLFCFL